MCDVVNLKYLEKVFPRLQGVKKVLEVGSYNVNGNSKEFVEGQDLSYLGVDINEGPDVDLVCDMTNPTEVSTHFKNQSFDLIICMNVLEHVFRPLNALDNMESLLSPKGYLLVIVPTVWDLHDWPADYYRLNPDFFTTYATEKKLDLLENSMLFSLRNNQEFFSDTRQLPMGIPNPHKNPLKKFLLRKLTKKDPNMRESFRYTYLNLTYQKIS